MSVAERPAHLGEIIGEQQGSVMIGYWFDALGFSPSTHPLTTELVVTALHLAGSVVMYFKEHFNRVRPWVLEPRLSPPIPLPGHPAYPSGHSTQMHLMALVLAYLVPEEEREEKRRELMDIAWNVAVNRERAGLHYRSDTEAGQKLAGKIFEVLTRDCASFRTSLERAKIAEWKEPAAFRVQRLDEETRAILSHYDLNRDIRARARDLAPENQPVRFQFARGELFIGEGNSLYFAEDRSSLPRLLVDGRAGAVVDFRVSPDGEKVAYGLKARGGDVSRWSVMDLTSGKLIGGDPVSIRLGTVYWNKTSTGLFYSGLPSPEEAQAGARGKRIRYRVVDSDSANRPSIDPVIFENPGWPNYASYGLQEIEPGIKYLAYRVQESAEIPLAAYLGERVDGILRWIPLFAWHDRPLGHFVTVHDSKALFRTSSVDGTPANRFVIIAVEIAEPFGSQILVPEDRDNVLIRAQRIGEFLALQYITPELKNAVRFVDLAGTPVSTWVPDHAKLPDHGTLSPLTGDSGSSKAYFTYESIAMPRQTLTVDLRGRPEVSLQSDKAYFADSPVNYTMQKYPSVDGTGIPIHLITRSDQENPAFTYLYYYGAIGVSTFPQWNTVFQMVLELGGAVAIANVRGGGELGAEWQLPVKLDRHKTLEDIVSASRWLKKHDTTAGKPVVISGRSYGGMHTLAAMVAFPGDFDLFVAQMPVSDVPKFLENGVFGGSTWDDFGFTHSDAGDLCNAFEEIETLKSWSPMQTLHKLPRLTKPILLVTAEFDERVEPDQASDFALALQDRFGPKAPVYLLVAPNEGHTAPTAVDELTFIARQLHVKELKPLFPKRTMAPPSM